MIRISLILRMIDSSRGVVLKSKIALCRYWIRTKQLLTRGGKFKDISNGYLEKGNDFMRLQDYAEAMHWYRKAAEQGNAIAQFNLGVMYSNGEGVRQDQTEAAKWYRLAAAQGNVSALCNLGVMYDGMDVGQDQTEAAKWYRLAAEQGNATAQFNLGLKYELGEGIPKNYTESVKWYRLAAEQGNAQAQYNLGVMYENGEGVN